MIFRDPTERELAREWATQTRLRAQFIRRLERQISRELTRTARETADVFEAGGIAGTTTILNQHEERLLDIIERSYRGVGEVFAQRNFDEAGKSFQLDLEQKGIFEDFQRRFGLWIEAEGLERAQRIPETTAQNIRQIILRGQEEGESSDVVARTIREKTGGAVGIVRARTIARTEMHAASVAANSESIQSIAQENGLRTLKEWREAPDGRVRDSHDRRDGGVGGQQREIGQSFDLPGGVKLLRPGQPGGPAREVINCRCVEVHVVNEPEFVFFSRNNSGKLKNRV